MIMGKYIFECSGFKDIVKFRFENGFIFIAENPKKDEVIINESDLKGIKYANYPWMSQCSVMNIELTFIYAGNGRQKTQIVILNHPGKDITELLDFLKDRYRETCFIGPTEQERAEILSSDHAGVYKLHALHILTPLGVISGLLFIFTFVLYLMIATTDQAIMPDPDKMNRAGLIILTLTLIPLGIMFLIEKKQLMVLRTDWLSISVQKFLHRKRYAWGSVIVKTPKSGIHNVYTGLYCEASDHGEVSAARALINVCLSVGEKEDAMLLMSIDEAGRFYRELYYRDKISLDEARQIRSFF
jgi:hypothetical protein